MEYHVVKYSGPFSFIKPWTAVRDSETFSQQFLTQSTIEGIEKKLFPELLAKKGIYKILRYKINYLGMDFQQERTWSKGSFRIIKDKNRYKTNMGIINRGVLLFPNLYLAFQNNEDANEAFKQSICLCRNEDILLPEDKKIFTLNEFERINGFELKFSNENIGYKVGYNRFNNNAEMFGELIITGNPLREI